MAWCRLHVLLRADRVLDRHRAPAAVRHRSAGQPNDGVCRHRCGDRRGLCPSGGGPARGAGSVERPVGGAGDPGGGGGVQPTAAPGAVGGGAAIRSGTV